MTVNELIKAFNNFDGSTEVEVFSGVDRSGIIESKKFENYCIMGNKGQAVLMPVDHYYGKDITVVLENIYNVVSEIQNNFDEDAVRRSCERDDYNVLGTILDLRRILNELGDDIAALYEEDEDEEA